MIGNKWVPNIKNPTFMQPMIIKFIFFFKDKKIILKNE